jgi:hypothetical protein
MPHRPVMPLAHRGASRFHTSSVANIAALAHVAVEKPGHRVLSTADSIGADRGRYCRLDHSASRLRWLHRRSGRGRIPTVRGQNAMVSATPFRAKLSASRRSRLFTSYDVC